MNSPWKDILTPAQIEAYHARTASLDLAFATGDRAWWQSRTAAQLRSEAAASWSANISTTYQLARSYLAKLEAQERQDRCEQVEAKLARLIQKAETGEQWGEICRIEAEEMAPLLVIVR